MELEVAIDTPPPAQADKYDSHDTFFRANHPVLLLQDPVLVKVLTMMLDVDGTLFNYWTLFCKRGLIFSFIHRSDFQDTFYRDNPSYRREERREGRKVKF